MKKILSIVLTVLFAVMPLSVMAYADEPVTGTHTSIIEPKVVDGWTVTMPMARCSVCGQITAYGKYCDMCGALLDPTLEYNANTYLYKGCGYEFQYCPHCGKLLQAGVSYCIWCGAQQSCTNQYDAVKIRYYIWCSCGGGGLVNINSAYDNFSSVISGQEELCCSTCGQIIPTFEIPKQYANGEVLMSVEDDRNPTLDPNKFTWNYDDITAGFNIISPGADVPDWADFAGTETFDEYKYRVIEGHGGQTTSPDNWWTAFIKKIILFFQTIAALFT